MDPKLQCGDTLLNWNNIASTKLRDLNLDPNIVSRRLEIQGIQRRLEKVVTGNSRRLEIVVTGNSKKT